MTIAINETELLTRLAIKSCIARGDAAGEQRLRRGGATEHQDLGAKRQGRH
jgi:hypothetical protein